LDRHFRTDSRGRARAIFIGDAACNLRVLFSANYAAGGVNATARVRSSAVHRPNVEMPRYECLGFHSVDTRARRSFFSSDSSGSGGEGEEEEEKEEEEKEEEEKEKEEEEEGKEEEEEEEEG